MRCRFDYLVDPEEPHENDHHDKDHLPEVLVKILCILRPEFIYPRHHKKSHYISCEDEGYSCDQCKALCHKGRGIDQNKRSEDKHDKYRSAFGGDYPRAMGKINCITVSYRLKAGKTDQICYNNRGEYIEKSQIFFFAEIPDKEVKKDNG